MDDQPALLSILIQFHWSHQTLALGKPVPGTIMVDVLAPEAMRAVVSVRAVRQWFRGFAAVFARERFLAGDEGHGEKRKPYDLRSVLVSH